MSFLKRFLKIFFRLFLEECKKPEFWRNLLIDAICQMNSKELQITMIRMYAQELVGPCTDYQISFCGVIAEKIPVQYDSLELLSESEVEGLALWIEDQYLTYSQRFGSFGQFP
jgi:hypothetical protein